MESFESACRKLRRPHCQQSIWICSEFLFLYIGYWMLLVKYIFPDTWALKFALLGRARTPIDHIKSMSSHATCRPFDDWLWFQWDFCKLLCFRVGSGGFYIFWALLLLLNSSLLEGMQIGVCDRSKILTRTRYYCTWSGRKSNEFYFWKANLIQYTNLRILLKNKELEVY